MEHPDRHLATQIGRFKRDLRDGLFSFFIALAIMIIGSQLFLAGFVAELVARNSPERNAYRVDERLGL